MSFLSRWVLARVIRHFRDRFVTGLLLLVPLAISYLILRFLFDNIDGLLQPALQKALGRAVPGTGLIALLVLIYMAGLLGTNILGLAAIRFGEAILMHIPLVRFLYGTSKQLVQSFTGTGTTGFKRVVIIEYPRPGIWTIGFLTGMTSDGQGHPLAVVYIPTAPTPNSGWVAILPADQVYDTDLSVQTAMSFTLSGGFISPQHIRKSPLRLATETPPAG